MSKFVHIYGVFRVLESLSGHSKVWKPREKLKYGTYLHDERRACGNIGLLGLQLSVGIVEAVPGGAHHVDQVCVHHREICETMRGDAQHAEVVV